MKMTDPKEIDLEQELEALYRKVAGVDQPDDARYPEQPLKKREADSAPRLRGRTKSPGEQRAGNTWRRLRNISGFIFIILILGMFALFFWPTLYENSALNRDGKVYPLRLNRLTGESSYFDGTAWLRTPQTKAVEEPVSRDPNDPLAVIVPPEMHTIEAWTEDRAAAPVPSEKSGRKQYAIQIMAFRENETPEALAFVEGAKKMLPGIRMKTVHIQGGDVWHKILVGTFTSLEAASDEMKVLKLSDAYPGSFITINPDE